MFPSSGSGHNKGWVCSLLDFLQSFVTSLPPLTQILYAHPFIAFLMAWAVLIVLAINSGIRKWLRCTGKSNVYHCLCLLKLPSFLGKKKIEGNLHLHFLRAPATDLGSELAGFSARRARICILQYFSCKAQSSSLELGHTFLWIYFSVFKGGSWGNRSSITPLLPEEKGTIFKGRE